MLLALAPDPLGHFLKEGAKAAATLATGTGGYHCSQYQTHRDLDLGGNPMKKWLKNDCEEGNAHVKPDSLLHSHYTGEGGVRGQNPKIFSHCSWGAGPCYA